MLCVHNAPHKRLCCVRNAQWSAVWIGGAGASQLVACAPSAKTRLWLFSSNFRKKTTFHAMCLFIFFLSITGQLKVCGLLMAFMQAVKFRNADQIVCLTLLDTQRDRSRGSRTETARIAGPGKYAGPAASTRNTQAATWVEKLQKSSFQCPWRKVGQSTLRCQRRQFRAVWR